VTEDRPTVQAERGPKCFEVCDQIVLCHRTVERVGLLDATLIYADQPEPLGEPVALEGHEVVGT
jgi:hypothetical protein